MNDIPSFGHPDNNTLNNGSLLFLWTSGGGNRGWVGFARRVDVGTGGQLKCATRELWILASFQQ